MRRGISAEYVQFIKTGRKYSRWTHSVRPRVFCHSAQNRPSCGAEEFECNDGKRRAAQTKRRRSLFSPQSIFPGITQCKGFPPRKCFPVFKSEGLKHPGQLSKFACPPNFKEANQMAVKGKIRIRLKGYDHSLVDKSAETIVETAKRTGAEAPGPVPLPR